MHLSPALAGLLISNPALMAAPFFVARTLKVVYDLMLDGAFALSERRRNTACQKSDKLAPPLTPLSGFLNRHWRRLKSWIIESDDMR